MACGKTTKKLTFITRKWPPAVGGMETYSVRLSEALGEYAHVSKIALPGQADGAPPKGRALLWWGLKTALRLLGKEGRAHATLVADLAIWPFALCAGRKGGIIAIAAHGTDVAFGLRPGLKGALYRAWLRLGAHLTRNVVVIANSRATAALARRTGFHNVRVVVLATDMSPPDPRPQVGEHLLFVGRLVPRKGCGWFIRTVLPKLPKEIWPRLRLRVIGPEWNQAESEALNDARVDYLGTMDPIDLAREYAAAAAVILPNIDTPTGEIEGFGLVAAEAAAAGGLVFASDHSGLRDALLEGRTGSPAPTRRCSRVGRRHLRGDEMV